MTGTNGHRADGAAQSVEVPRDLWEEPLRAFEHHAEGGRMAERATATAEVVVAATPGEAFAIFTDEIGLWWRTDTPYWNDRERGRSVRIEAGLGGRFIEVYDLESGTGFEVGRVTAWEPGERLALTWTQVGWPRGAVTEVEITFEPVHDGTRVRLEHTGFDQVSGAEAFVGGYDAGWKTLLGFFAERANTRRG